MIKRSGPRAGNTGTGRPQAFGPSWRFAGFFLERVPHPRAALTDSEWRDFSQDSGDRILNQAA